MRHKIISHLYVTKYITEGFSARDCSFGGEQVFVEVVMSMTEVAQCMRINKLYQFMSVYI